MFKETATEKLIEYIMALPDGERKLIVRKIKSRQTTPVEGTQKRVKDFVAYTKSFSGRLPKNYQFNREEANER